MSFNITSREGIQWNDDPISEPTSTFVLSCNSHFVDIRVFEAENDKEFPFDWAMHGEIVAPSSPDGETSYTHDIDSRYINAVATGSKDAEKFLEIDSGFTVYRENGDHAETGTMLNPDTMQVERFLEIWRPLDANKAPEKVPRGNSDHSGKVHCLVLVPKEGQKFTGKLVKVGHWVQAILKEQDVDGVQSLSILRAAKPTGDGKFTPLVSWGTATNRIPLEFSSFAPSAEVTINGLVWKCLY